MQIWVKKILNIVMIKQSCDTIVDNLTNKYIIFLKLTKIQKH